MLPTSPCRILALLGRAMVLPFRLSMQTRQCVSAVPTRDRCWSYRSRHNCHTSMPPVLLTPLRVTRHKGSAWKSSNIEWSSRNPRYHFPVVMDCATTRRFRKGWRWWQSRIAEGTTRLSDDVLRRSTLSARTMRTSTTAWDSIRTNFGRPMKTKDSFGM